MALQLYDSLFHAKLYGTQGPNGEQPGKRAAMFLQVVGDTFFAFANNHEQEGWRGMQCPLLTLGGHSMFAEYMLNLFSVFLFQTMRVSALATFCMRFSARRRTPQWICSRCGTRRRRSTR